MRGNANELRVNCARLSGPGQMQEARDREIEESGAAARLVRYCARQASLHAAVAFQPRDRPARCFTV